jgi:hypothetical protein
MQTRLSKLVVFLAAIAACLVLANPAKADMLTVHEDSATRLDFTFDWSNFGNDVLYANGRHDGPGGIYYDTWIDAQEHVPFVYINLASVYFAPSILTGSNYPDGAAIWIELRWTYPDAVRGPGVPPTDPAYDRTLDWIHTYTWSTLSTPPWYSISPDGQSARFVYGLAPSGVPDGGSTFILLASALALCAAGRIPPFARHSLNA